MSLSLSGSDFQPCFSSLPSRSASRWCLTHRPLSINHWHCSEEDHLKESCCFSAADSEYCGFGAWFVFITATIFKSVTPSDQQLLDWPRFRQSTPRRCLVKKYLWLTELFNLNFLNYEWNCDCGIEKLNEDSTNFELKRAFVLAVNFIFLNGKFAPSNALHLLSTRARTKLTFDTFVKGGINIAYWLQDLIKVSRDSFHFPWKRIFSLVIGIVQDETKTPRIMACCGGKFCSFTSLEDWRALFRGKWTLEWVSKASLFVCLALYFHSKNIPSLHVSHLCPARTVKNVWFRAQNSAKNNCLKTNLAQKISLFLSK